MLLTHHHFDHVSDVGELRERWPGLQVLISERERDLLDAGAATGADGQAGGEAESPGAGMGLLEAGQTLRFGALEVRPLHTPGHTGGMLSFSSAPRGAGAARRCSPATPCSRARSAA